MSNKTEQNKLLILWTNDNIETAERMVFMFAGNSIIHQWWQQVTLLIWGATAKLAAENDSTQKQLSDLLELGVEVIACKECANMYGVADQLEKNGTKVFYTGEYLSKWIQEDNKVLSI